MKTMRLLNSRLSIFVRGIVQNLLAFFRFTEADALVLLSAYGLHALELDRLQNSRTDEPPETNPNSARASQPGSLPRLLPSVRLQFHSREPSFSRCGTHMSHPAILGQ